VCEGGVVQALGGKGKDGSLWWDLGGDGESDEYLTMTTGRDVGSVN